MVASWELTHPLPKITFESMIFLFPENNCGSFVIFIILCISYRWPTTAMLLPYHPKSSQILFKNGGKPRFWQNQRIHPWRLTWNIITEVWKIIFLSILGWFVRSILIFQGAGVQECHFCCGLRGTQFNRLRNCRSQNIIKKSLCFGCCSALRWSTFF